MNREVLLQLSNDPGCYLYKNNEGVVIYVGKAKNLKKRVSSYFQKKEHDPKTQALLSHIATVEVIITPSETEALLLENNLIKKYLPKYNIDLRDSQRYAYLCMTKEQFPRLIIARDKTQAGFYYGPFVSGAARDLVQHVVTNTFHIRTCHMLPKRACLRFHMQLCDAPCVNKIDEAEYTKCVDQAKKVLAGDANSLIDDLQKEMRAASEVQDFEVAKQRRDTVAAIQALSARQLVERQKTYDQDVINYVVKGEQVCVGVFSVQRGVLLEKSEFAFDKSLDSLPDLLEEFLLQYYDQIAIPQEIILPLRVSRALQKYLSNKRRDCEKKEGVTKNSLNDFVRIIVPLRGERKLLLDLVKKNLEKKYVEEELVLFDVQEKLCLESLPRIVECFDISHLSGTNTVASMARFVNAQPDKSSYRRFRIRSVIGIDDFASMAEVVQRRYSRLIAEKKELPHLIVVDGGKGQLSFAKEELLKLGLLIPIIGLAKKNEEVYFPGLSFPKMFDKKSRALQFLQRVRDEAHRFAITYQRLLRKKRVLEQEKQ